jgi:ATP-dependent Lon protease
MKIPIDMLENKEEIFTTYQPKMQQFFLKLPSIEQNQILELENEIKKLNNEATPLRYQLLQSNMDVKVKAIAMRKLNSLNSMDSSSGEYYKIQSYLDGLMKIPFGKYIDLPISSSNTSQEITSFMIKSNDILNEAVYGHQLAKSNILQTLGKWISNPSAKGSVFSILGPMGNGKTTLVKEGIAKMIQRPFEFISLGGATDSSFLDGHSYTYEGSMAGKIVEILKKTQCMNPVIYFDELDKVSQTPRGDEIINLLIHLTDFSQNDVFMDKYYSDIPLDLSKAVFIFSLNSLENLNPILRDRMQVIKTDKLEEKDKIIISQKYMIPKILKEVNLTDENIIIPEETIKFAISQYSVESGVRNLKRCYETLLEKINIWRLLNVSGNELTNLNFSTQVQKIFAKPISFPLTVTQDLLKKIMDEKAIEEQPPMMMYT